VNPSNSALVIVSTGSPFSETSYVPFPLSQISNLLPRSEVQESHFLDGSSSFEQADIKVAATIAENTSFFIFFKDLYG